jgi:hypothetical protein
MTTLNHASKTTPVTNLENTIQNMVKDVEKNAEALVD